MAPAGSRPRWLLASCLFAASFVTATTLGAVLYVWTRTDVTTSLGPFLLPAPLNRLVGTPTALETLRAVWSEPALLSRGLAFSTSLLFILLCHELGHYLACRHYRLPATLPYFLPAPLAFGTFGAFIKIKAPIRSKRELFDVGIAGPLAGFVALVPFLILGIALSHPAPLDLPSEADLQNGPLARIFVPGHNLAFIGLTRLFHGPIPETWVLDLHPFALAAWVGLLATALNLLPLGQLDGGHILYASIGALHRRLVLPLWFALVAASVFWPGWILWCLITLFLGLRHPPVWDESLPLDRTRRRLAWLALLIFVVAFSPVPAEEILVVP